MLRAYATKMSTKCEQYLPILEFDYNSSKHTSTRYSPFMLMTNICLKHSRPNRTYVYS